ncbi:unnamed protein product [Tuber melanosporum]|uniref:(Perigord truffle) hypothetical protein n=1 Tax=Tuber melanosporum (strain Mel28) TaxID=656061 RepID=D5GB28_TUBMM|nr:uncharacterized protein GSTUM_00005414001 [Tuber melanosporum]CAZ81721.1 unnamed protein product [Tuber melanosporum]
MASLEFLATELLLNIVQYVETPEEFTTVDGSKEQPSLKNLSSTCRRLRAVCFPFLFRSVKLPLEKGHTCKSIEELRSFILNNALEKTIESIGLAMGSQWNEGKVGLELKKFLWEISVKSLSIRQYRTHHTLREKSARWPYFLATLERLRLEEVDDDNDLKILLLKQCPIRLLHVNDGNFRSLYEEDDKYFLGRAESGPGITSFKPSAFPNLTTVVYHAAWPPYNRFDGFLEFVSKLPAIKVLEVKLMGDEDLELDLKRKSYKLPPDAIRFIEVVSAYQILAWRVGTIDSLQRLVIRDHRIPYHGETDPPQSFAEGPVGTYQRQNDTRTQ